MAEFNTDMQQRLANAVPSSTGHNLTSSQARFDYYWITVGEIAKRVNVSKPTVLKKLRDRFQPVPVGKSYIYERTLELEEFITLWANYRAEIHPVNN